MNPTGTGLGLMISDVLSRGLCDSPEAQGLIIESTEGQGTKISFMITNKFKDPISVI